MIERANASSRRYCSADGWAGFVEGFRKACDARNSSYENLGELAGLPPRTSTKSWRRCRSGISARNRWARSWALPASKSCWSKIPKCSAALEKRFVPRKAGRRRDATGSMRHKKRHKWRRFGSTAAERQILHSRRMLLTTARQRSTWAKRAAKARWCKRHIARHTPQH